jgi:hypothetical protein
VKRKRQFSNDGVNWVDAAPEFQRSSVVLNSLHRYTRIVEEEDLGAYVGPDGLRRALEAMQRGERVSDDELRNALKAATPEERAWFEAEMLRAFPAPKLGEAIRAGNALASGSQSVGYDYSADGAGEPAVEYSAEMPRLGGYVALVHDDKSPLRLADRESEHPTPWKWVDEHTLTDANGRDVIGILEPIISEHGLEYTAQSVVAGFPDDGSWRKDPASFAILEASPRARALTEAAPELADALAFALSVLAYERPGAAPPWVEKARALLTRIEAASKGGDRG